MADNQLDPHETHRRTRRHDEERDDGQRTPFERDRDAILYTTAFRRLAGVTQVVSPLEAEIVHNRLTHTLEVAQIALRLAQQLEQRQRDLAKSYHLNPDVVEAAALAHDLGHPPFGHVAEQALNDLLVKEQIEDGFEGNAQSFRILTKLAVRRHSDPLNESLLGLNLTRATLNATIKYPRKQNWKTQQGDPKEWIQEQRKWGYYQSEEIDFQFARQPVDSSRNLGTNRSLEACVMDWADDIAYSIHDTEDFFRVGLIPLELFTFATKSGSTGTAIDRFFYSSFPTTQ